MQNDLRTVVLWSFSGVKLALVVGLLAGLPGLIPEMGRDAEGDRGDIHTLSHWVGAPTVAAAAPTESDSQVSRSTGALLETWPDLFQDEKASLSESRRKAAGLIDRIASSKKTAPADLTALSGAKASTPAGEEENLAPQPPSAVPQTPAIVVASSQTSTEETSLPTSAQPGQASEPNSPKLETTVTEAPPKPKSTGKRGIIIKAEKGVLVAYDADGNPVLSRDPKKDPKVTLIGKGKKIEVAAEPEPPAPMVELPVAQEAVLAMESLTVEEVEKAAEEEVNQDLSGDGDIGDGIDQTPEVQETEVVEGTPIFYEIKKGENLSLIASRYPGVTSDRLMEVNQIEDPHSIQIGEKIWIPTTFEGVRHKVEPGETLSDLVKLYEIDNLFEICDLNGFPRTQNKLEPGTILVLPGAKARPPQTVKAPTHAIQPKLSDLKGKVTWNWPVESTFKVSSPYGLRVDPFSGKKSSAGGGQDKRWRKTMHHGLDMAVPTGSGVYAAREGQVVEAGRRGNHGLSIKMVHEDGWFSVYSHNSKLMVKKGDKIEQGDLIALSGNTGRSTGPHVHFEIRRPDQKSVNPSALLGPRP